MFLQATMISYQQRYNNTSTFSNMPSTTNTFQKLFAKHVKERFHTKRDNPGDASKAPKSTTRPSTWSRFFLFRRHSAPATIMQAWKKGDSYRDIKELAHGTEARTSLTKSFSTGRIFVVKRFKTYTRFPERSNSNPESQPMPDEATLLMNTLRPHPNILEVFGCDLFGGLKANVYTEFCAGGDLMDQIMHFFDMNWFAPEMFALHVLLSLSNALAYLHYGLRWDSQVKQYWAEPGHVSIVHGDIKPENVFLRWSNKPERAGFPDIVLGDFNQSQPANNFRGYSGTCGYQAPGIDAIHALKTTDPEGHRAALRTTGHMTFASDLYSLGQTIHMLVRGRLHVVGADPYVSPVQAVIDEQRRKSVGVDFTAQGKPSYRTKGFTEAVQWCLQPDPAMRPKVMEGSLFGVLKIFRKSLEEMLQEGEKIPGAMWASLPGENTVGQ